ncbi:cell envelope integrity protein TolA [Psychrobacter sp. P2G3]|uniref:cell envelope integrity protein TolA n=1 Tax=unclassified Psychrobacter TaxID=196806 RepID=UPI001D174908|nr:cell envelope integrity protein TolA [Psychrobacter sp. P2G3]
MSIKTMNNAPAVYVPTPPEGNGLTLPMILSLLAHGIVLGILIYTYQSPELETVGNIETTMVTPGELAEMQGQILANRAAMQAASSSDGSAVAIEQMNANSSSNASQTNVPPNTQRESIFTRSDDPADRPVLMSQEQHQRRTEQMQEYERNIAELAAQLDESALAELNEVEQQKQNELDAERARLKSFRNTENNPPKIKRPNNTQSNLEIDTGNSSSAGKNFSLSDGQSTVSGSTTTSGQSAGSNSNASGGSRGASNSEIINLIRRNYNPPIAAKGSTQRATLTITVNSNGDVVNVSVSGSDPAVNEAAKQAVLSTRNLPIDTDDPKYPTFTVQFKGSN